MAPIRIKHVVSFSSQDPQHRVENLCEEGGAGRPWLCGRAESGAVLRAELQLERASGIYFIDVGNYGSAFIQVDVGRSSWSSDHPYVTLLPTAALMTPADSRQGKGRQSVRMFKKVDFLSQAVEDSWDRLRVTCTQPFNKHAQFGLSFLRLRSAEELVDEVSFVEEDNKNQGTPEKTQTVRDWFSSPAVQHTFFGGQTGHDSPGGSQRTHGSLSRAERMVTAAQSRRLLPIDPHKTLASSTVQAETKNQNAKPVPHLNGIKGSTPPERRGNSKTRPLQTSKVSTPKRSRSAGCGDSACKYGRTSTTVRTDTKTVNTFEHSPVRTGTKTVNTFEHSPVKTHAPGILPTQYLPDNPEPPESVCPICGVSFSPDYLPVHASSCLDSASVGLSEDVDPDMASLSSHPRFIQDDFMVPCPLCSFRFPKDCIEQHASTCGDTVWVD